MFWLNFQKCSRNAYQFWDSAMTRSCSCSCYSSDLIESIVWMCLYAHYRVYFLLTDLRFRFLTCSDLTTGSWEAAKKCINVGGGGCRGQTPRTARKIACQLYTLLTRPGQEKRTERLRIYWRFHWVICIEGLFIDKCGLRKNQSLPLSPPTLQTNNLFSSWTTYWRTFHLQHN